MPKIYIEPKIRPVDSGEGGIRRVIEAQYKWLPQYGFEIVEKMDRADIVATHAGDMPIVPVNKPWVVHCHGLYWEGYDWPAWAGELNKRVIEAMRRCDHVTVPSKWIGYVLQRGMWMCPTVLYHGINPGEWVGGKNQGYVLWNKTRVDNVCDPQPLNEVAKLMPDTQFVSTFGNPAKNVKLTGCVPYPKAHDLIINAGVYLATTRETMGIGTLEAFAAGIPVVGWNWGGTGEIIRHKDNGWLCQPGDYAGLVEGIRWVSDSRQRIADIYKKEIQNWTWEAAIKRYADLYKNILDKFEVRKKSPKVSIVMPCYKAAQWMPDAIKSVQSQTLKNWELIIVSDASPDDAKIARDAAAKDTRIKVIENSTQQGVSGAKNTGLKTATGQYFINIDADNRFPTNALEVLATALDKDRSIHITYGAIKFILPDGKPDTKISADGISKWPFDFSFDGQMKYGHNQIQSSAMYRRELWERTGGYRERFKTAEDADYWTRAVSMGFVPKKATSAVTLIYINRLDSVSRTNKETDWTQWYPWSKDHVVPFGAASICLNKSGWPVPAYENPKISVIIACGPGHEKILIDALDSVEAQSFRDWECIVVNDTCHDLKICQPWVKVYDTKGKEGPGVARNLGISKAKSQLFIPLDADDYLLPNALEEFYRVWLEEKRVVYSQWWDDHGNGDIKVWNPPDYDPKKLITNGCLHAVTALYPVSAWQKVGGFDTTMKNWEDWDFQIALASKGICETKIDKPLFVYRKYTGTRRENAAVNFNDGKQEILSKWERFWKGEELMACGGCGKKVSRNTVVTGGNIMPINTNINQPLVLIEYAGNAETSMTFKGQVTRTQYRFGNNESHKRRYVYAQDVAAFLAIKGQFREIQESKPIVPEYQPAIVIPEVKAIEPETQTQTVKATVAVLEPEPEISVSDLRKKITSMSKEDMALMLSKEKTSSNRTTIIKILEKGLKE
jgi:glycosyltransferase involved in cell wall biosynthesis